MKLFKLLFSVLFLLTLSTNFSTAGGTKEICPGQPTTLVWTSSNADINGCSGGVTSGNEACNFIASSGGSLPINGAQTSCTVNYSCSGPGGRSVPDPDSATLVVNNRNDYWNGTQCVCNASTPVWNAGANICEACPTGTDWNGTVCVPILATGNISANPSPCIIPAGSGNCASTLTWASTNNVSPNIRADGASIISTIANGSLSVPWISYGGNYFELRNSSTVIAGIIVKGECDTNTNWNPSVLKCSPICPAGQQLNTAGTSCVTSCPTGSSWIPSLNACRCPAGQYLDGANNTTGTCRNLVTPILDATYSGLLNPALTPTCSAPLVTQSITRNIGVNNIVTNGNNAVTDLGVTSQSSSVTYTYTLTCIGTGDNSYITQTTTKDLLIPAKVTITNISNSITPTGSPVTATWNSTGNECTLYSKGPRTEINTITKTNTGVNAFYNYSYTLNPAVRTELNSSRIGSGVLGYDIECRDTAQPIRVMATGLFRAEVFKAPVAAIVTNGSNINFSCTTDYNKVDIKKNGLSISTYPKTYSVIQTANLNVSSSYDINSIYQITCSYGNYDSTAISSTDLQLLGSINGSGVRTANNIETITSSSSDGKIGNIYYQAFNSNSISVTKNGVLVANPSSPYFPVSRKANINSTNDTGTYDPLTIVVTAKKTGSPDKVLTLIQNKVLDVFADIEVRSTPTTLNQDLVTINITCKNATSYEVYKTTLIMPGYPALISGSGDTFTTELTDTASGTGTETTYKVKCIKGSSFKEDSARVSIISKTPVKISALIIQPEQIACPGGNDSATLKLIMSNTVGKVCKITPSAINATNNISEKATQMSALNTQLSSSNYVSSNSVGKKSLTELMSDRNPSGVVGGSIVLSSTSKLSTEKRLFTYSTRFKLECGSTALAEAVRYNPTNNPTYSTKSVDMLSTCIGQD